MVGSWPIVLDVFYKERPFQHCQIWCRFSQNHVNNLRADVTALFLTLSLATCVKVFCERRRRKEQDSWLVWGPVFSVLVTSVWLSNIELGPVQRPAVVNHLAAVYLWGGAQQKPAKAKCAYRRQSNYLNSSQSPSNIYRVWAIWFTCVNQEMDSRCTDSLSLGGSGKHVYFYSAPHFDVSIRTNETTPASPRTWDPLKLKFNQGCSHFRVDSSSRRDSFFFPAVILFFCFILLWSSDR